MRTRVTKTVLTLSMLGGLVISCGTEHSESCEWEQKKKSTSLNALVTGYEGKVGGSSGGGSRGGSSSRGGGSSSSSGGSGSRPNMNKGGNAAPKYNKSNPAPKPTAPAGTGKYWAWDCD